MPVVPIGAAVAGWLGAGTVSAVVAGAIGGAIVGAVVGGVTAAINGGDVLDGMFKGALTGAVTGAFSGWMQGGQVSTGQISTTGGTTIPAGTPVDTSGLADVGMWNSKDAMDKLIRVDEVDGTLSAVSLEDSVTLDVEAGGTAHITKGGVAQTKTAAETVKAAEKTAEGKHKFWGMMADKTLNAIGDAMLAPSGAGGSGSGTGGVGTVSVLEGQGGRGPTAVGFHNRPVQSQAPGAPVVGAPTPTAGAVAATPTAVAPTATPSALAQPVPAGVK